MPVVARQGARAAGEGRRAGAPGRGAPTPAGGGHQGQRETEAARLRRDADHKDKILSAMLRKSKIDMEDREILVQEVKLCKAVALQRGTRGKSCYRPGGRSTFVLSRPPRTRAPAWTGDVGSQLSQSGK